MKEFLIRWLLKNERADLKESRTNADLAQARYEALAGQYQALVETQQAYTIVDCVREQLKGINPRKLTKGSTLPESVGDLESQSSFLEDVKKLYENPALYTIVESLISDQVVYSVKEAPKLEEINFGRATVNGVSLFREEVERLHTVYLERHTPEEEYDEHEAL